MSNNPEVYPATPLFEEGVTAARVVQVAKSLAAAMRGNCPEVLPAAVSVHSGPDGGEVTHVGWPLYEEQKRIPKLDVVTHTITREQIWNTLYLADNGELGSCMVRQDGRYLDVDLNEHVLRKHDTDSNYDTGRVSALRDLFNTRFVAKALTAAAFNLDQYLLERDGRPNGHILETLKGFAASDNPRPDYALGEQAGPEGWPRR